MTLVFNSIDADLACFQCGYNLRTLDAAANCPECGKAIIQTIEIRNRTLALNLPHLINGAMLLAAHSILLAGAIIVIPRLHFISFLPEFIIHLLLTVPAVMGVVQLGRARPLRGFSKVIFVLCILTAGMQPIVTHGWLLIHWIWARHPYAFFQFKYDANMAWVHSAVVFICLASAATPLLLGVGMGYIRTVAKILGRPWLASLGTAALVVLAFRAALVTAEALGHVVICGCLIFYPLGHNRPKKPWWLSDLWTWFERDLPTLNVLPTFIYPIVAVVLWRVLLLVAQRAQRGIFPKVKLGFFSAAFKLFTSTVRRG